MHNRRPTVSIAIAAVTLALATASTLHAQPAPPTAPDASAARATRLSDARIAEILNERIVKEKRAVGMIAVLVDGDQVRFVPAGNTRLGAESPVTPDTLFEIGSISKTFTSLLLADMALKGDVKLDDPVEKYLPQDFRGLKLRDHTGAPIRLVDLATHRSGIARMPDNMPNGTRFDPYVDYRERELLQYLKAREILVETDGGKTTRKRDEAYEYSNFGFGLLGYALGRAAKTSYADLLQKRVLTPLGMTSTWLNVPGSADSRYSDGHYIEKDGSIKRARHWRFDVLAPAGAIVTSGRDLARYAQAASGAVDTPLADAFKLAQKKYADGPAPINPMGLGWIIAPLNGRTVFSHGGQTGGFSTSLWADPERKVAVAVLANTGGASPDDIALHLLEPSIPVKAVIRPQTAISVDEKTLALYPGTYKLAPNFDVVVRLRDGRLYAQATGQGEFELFAKAANAFFARVANIEIVFNDIKDAKAMSFAITQGGGTRNAPRVE